MTPACANGGVYVPKDPTGDQAMAVVIFSDVHADAGALAAMLACIGDPHFGERFGAIDTIVNLGDLLHRGDHPQETLEEIQDLSRKYRLISLMGNHDHAFLTGLPVSGSDAASAYRHEQIRGSPMLSMFDTMPVEWVGDGMLFVHGGPLELGPSTLRLKFWQRLGREAGDSYAGYYYTPAMAFSLLKERNLRYLCCGHQHTSLCCMNHPGTGVQPCKLDYSPIAPAVTSDRGALYEARIALDSPAILRVGACHGTNPEFACTDFKTFSFLRIA